MDNNEPTIESLREEIAAKDSALAEMNAAAETAAKEYENAKAEFAKQLADKDSEIAALKAEAKTAEQIAAEKYGAALKPESVPASGGGDGLSPEEISKLVANAKDDPRAFARLAKDLSKDQIRRMRA